MSQTEVVLKSKALAAKLDEKAAVLLEKKLANDRFKERIEECDEAVLKLSREVRTRLEERPIECTESPRYGEMMVDLIRMDTGEVVSSRPMHPSERQQALSLEGGGEAA
jgi:hypothetical protein